MLNAANVRQHGMIDKRWTTSDKISQYKALVNLFTRDRQLFILDKLKNKQSQPKYAEFLAKGAIKLRKKKDEALFGDKQAIRNALLPNKSKQLAYQGLPPEHVIEHIDKDNFDSRKELDRMIYKIKVRRDKLVGLKLEVAVLEDRLKYDSGESIPIEIKVKKVTAAVQDAMLKKVAAISVRNIYKDIIHVMKKDSIYFDAILITLHIDMQRKQHCLMRTIQLGQLATESLDDRRAECNTLEAKLKRIISNREVQIKQAAEIYLNITKKVCQKQESTIFRESATVLYTKSPIINNTELENDVSYARTVLLKLEDASRCVGPDQLIPCFIEQAKQYKRILDIKDYIFKGKDAMMNKLDHAQLVDDELETKMGDETAIFNEEECELKRLIKEQDDRKDAILKEVKSKHEELSKIQMNLKSLMSAMDMVCVPSKKRKLSAVIQTDPAMRAFETIYKKVLLLMEMNAPPLDEEKAAIAGVMYSKMDRLHIAVDFGVKPNESATKLVAEVNTEDPLVPTRETIKLLSRDMTILGKHRLGEDDRKGASFAKHTIK